MADEKKSSLDLDGPMEQYCSPIARDENGYMICIGTGRHESEIEPESHGYGWLSFYDDDDDTFVEKNEKF